MSLIMSRTVQGYDAVKLRADRSHVVATTYMLVAVDMLAEDEMSRDATSVLGRGLTLDDANESRSSFNGMLPNGIKLVVVPTGSFDLA
jgi:hypothetical protein